MTLSPRLIFPAPPQLSPNPACAQMTHFSSAFLCWVDGPAFLHLQKHQATLPCSCPQHPSMTIPGSALPSGPPGPSSWLLSRGPVFILPLLPSLSRAAGGIFGSSDHVQPSSNVFRLLSLRRRRPHLPRPLASWLTPQLAHHRRCLAAAFLLHLLAIHPPSRGPHRTRPHTFAG